MDKSSRPAIPKGWRETELGCLAKVVGGGTPKKSAPDYWDGDIVWLTPRDLSGYSKVYIDSGKRNISEFGLRNSSATLLPQGSVLLTSRAPIGYVAITKTTLSTNQGFKGLIISDTAHNLYIYYWLKSHTNYLQNMGTGTTFGEISNDTIKRIKIVLPPLPEQKAIAEVLSNLDDKIELLHRQRKTLDAMAQTLFRKWFIEEASEDWEIGKLGDVIENFDSKRIPLSKMQRNRMKDGRLYPYYGATKIMDFVNDYIFDGEYILLGEDGTVKTNTGNPIIQYAQGKFWVNNHTHVLKAKKPYDNFFIWHFLLGLNVENIITGAVQLKINQLNLKSVQFPKYPSTSVAKFQKKLGPSLKKILLNKSQIQVLEALRDALLPKLMSGKVRVKDFAK